jgi:hypothetical protein
MFVSYGLKAYDGIVGTTYEWQEVVAAVYFTGTYASVIDIISTIILVSYRRSLDFCMSVIKLYCELPYESHAL